MAVKSVEERRADRKRRRDARRKKRLGDAPSVKVSNAKAPSVAAISEPTEWPKERSAQVRALGKDAKHRPLYLYLLWGGRCCLCHGMTEHYRVARIMFEKYRETCFPMIPSSFKPAEVRWAEQRVKEWKQR